MIQHYINSCPDTDTLIKYMHNLYQCILTMKLLNYWMANNFQTLLTSQKIKSFLNDNISAAKIGTNQKIGNNNGVPNIRASLLTEVSYL